MAWNSSLALLQKKVPDGDVRNIRGAKRGGYTDHLAGMHLIPNVGREAMVPAEVVKRQPRLVRKEPPKAPPPVPKAAKQSQRKQPECRRRSPSRSRRRSRSRSRSRWRSRSSSSEGARREDGKPGGERAKSPDAATKRRNEEERQRQRQREIEAYREAERSRQEQERIKLEAFKEAQMKRKELDSVRKKRLIGAFALNEDDIPEEDGEGAPPKSLAHARPRVSTSLAPHRSDPGPGPLPYAGNASSAALRISDGEKVTAADLDGSQHDHKFSAVWKDWNAQKRDDPGEIAKQFMKIAAIKRRGFDKR